MLYGKKIWCFFIRIGVEGGITKMPRKLEWYTVVGKK